MEKLSSTEATVQGGKLPGIVSDFFLFAGGEIKNLFGSRCQEFPLSNLRLMYSQTSGIT